MDIQYNVREFQWDSLKSIHKYALAKGLTHLEPLFPFAVITDLLAADINYDTVKSRSWATTDPVVNIFLAELYKILEAPPVDAYQTKKRREEIDIEDEEENDEFRSILISTHIFHISTS